MPIGRPLVVEAEMVGDFAPFSVGLQQGIRRLLAVDGGGHCLVQRRQIFGPAGQSERAEPLLVTQCGLWSTTPCTTS